MSQNFGPVYWIGLDKRPDKAWTVNHNTKILGPGHPINMVSAYDGTRLRLLDDPAGRSNSHLRGAVGCYLSHLNVLQQIANSKQDALVLEDDALLNDDFLEVIDSKIDDLGEWDHIMLAEDNETGTWAYITKWQTAEKLVKLLQDRVYPIDVAILFLGRDGHINFKRIPGTVKHLVDDYGTNVAGDGNCELRPDLTFDGNGEDLFLETYFADKPSKGRTFLDVGCGDARNSVTRRLALVGGWRGIYVEPDPYQWVRLNLAYSRIGDNEFICAAMSPGKEIRSLMINRTPGKSTTDPALHEKRKQELLFWGCCRSPTITPEEVVALFGNDFELVNLNCSGLDELVLKSSGHMLERTQVLRVKNSHPILLASEAHGFKDRIMETDSHVILIR